MKISRYTSIILLFESNDIIFHIYLIVLIILSIFNQYTTLSRILIIAIKKYFEGDRDVFKIAQIFTLRSPGVLISYY